ncbi:hypothetical protein MUK42_17635 [Musa troglodytarum]|uniref:CUE domain-containing protein n=1 Tax=Musa troglodytarum TaxID=320322 RepID=A0A9E7HXI5_9LILI|nr:hypothetical protein MUK42_17635 [Musa troglodytarum]URE41807.1 hypothetical protein MUK42_17635 [Musa troglodytarum]
MSSKEVFTSLKKLFPQVDLRILKAAAIEHANDVDSAAEFILLDVLPSIVGSCEVSCTLQDTDETEHSSAVGLNLPVGKGKQPILSGSQEEEETTSHISGQEPVSCEIAVSDGDTSSASVMSPCIGEVDPRGLQIGITDYIKELECPTSRHNAFEEPNTVADSEPNFMEKGIDQTSLHPNSHVHEKFVDVALCNLSIQVNVAQLSPGSAHDEHSLEQTMMQSSNGKSETIVNVVHGSAQIDSSLAALLVNGDVQNAALEPFERNFNAAENRKITNDGTFSVHGSVEQSRCSVEPASVQGLNDLEANDSVSAVTMAAEDFKVCGGCLVNEVTTSTTECEELHSELADASVADLLSFESQMLSINDNDLPATLNNRSGHFVSTGYLEDLLSNAKSNKTNLLSAVELTTNMMREVKLLEERRKQAKDAATFAGQDILAKVEELKEISRHAKEANDMLAGEVYGEKAILATEARELQFRLLSLSDKRNKSLSMIEEIRQTVEASLAATEEEIAAAEQEKLEKEELARKALSKQEAVMAAAMEESKKLQQEAEANSKLREFLMDRGRVVDALQGEINIICEDVMLLKEIVDGRVPLNGSLRSTALSLLASSSSSSYRSKHSSDGVLEHDDLLEKSAITEQEHEIQQNDKSNLSGHIQGAQPDDGWELLKGGVLCS